MRLSVRHEPDPGSHGCAAAGPGRLEDELAKERTVVRHDPDVVVAALALAFVVGWRAKSRLVLGPIVWFSKKVMNPMQMRTAGTPGAYASIIRHRGRISGARYATPVGVVADGRRSSSRCRTARARSG